MLTAAGIQSISVVGIILLRVRLGDLQVSAWFGVVENVFMQVLLRT